MLLSIANCEVTEQIYESQDSLVYRGIRQADKLPVILKVLKQNYPTPAELARYKQEYHITKKLELTGVINVYGLEPYERSLIMLLEDFGATSLKDLFEGQVLQVKEFLDIAIKITEILGQIHESKVIHKDINPSNIVLNQQSSKLKIIDFGISSELTREITDFGSTKSLEGTLAYIAPEQTGRMNRNVGYRSDFYSLGVTFYKLLTGKLPFDGNDALEVIYGHIAKQPLAPLELKPELPEVLSEIVLKLMSKNVEDRYQSAYGLKADLEKVQHQLESKKIINFPLGETDYTGQFILPQKLYGRDIEKEQLLKAFEKANRGTSVMLLVKGRAGIGKSALIKELHKPITEKRGYFVEGKFDQFQRNIPYAALGKALDQLCKYILAEGSVSIEKWKGLFEKALGHNGQIIIDLAPSLELIIGKQPAVTELGGDETQNRLLYTFGQFLTVLGDANRPLTLFLDDLQWADAASLRLLELIGTSPEISHVLVIGAYRDNELDEAHPLKNTLQNISKEKEIIEINLSPLSPEMVSVLIADTLSTTKEKVAPLAELVYRKTEGNPFFVSEFMQHLYEEEWLWFNFAGREWQWQTKKIEAVQMTSNVVELLLAKMQKLAELPQQILMYGACLGNVFNIVDLDNLKLISASSLRDLQRACIELVNGGFINQVIKDMQYRFVHDRVQQAGYALLPEKLRAQTHKLIGEAILASAKEEEKQERLFEIVDHLNQGADLFTDEQEKIKLAQLNLEAGQRSRLSTAYQEAFRYVETGIALLPEDTWAKEYELSLLLYEEATEIAYLTGGFKDMEGYAETILDNASNVLDTLKVHKIKIRTYSHQLRYAESINLSRKILAKLGVRLPHKPSKLHIIVEFTKVNLALKGKSLDDIYNLPKMENKRAIAVLQIMTAIAATIYIYQPSLVPLMSFILVKYSLKYGNHPLSVFGYAVYSLVLSSLQHIDRAYKIGKLALSLLDKYKDSPRSRVGLTAVYFTFYKKRHLKEVLDLLKEFLQDALAEGDLEYVGYIAQVNSSCFFLIGTPLPELAQELDKMASLVSKVKQELSLTSIQMLRQVTDSLINTPKFHFLKGKFFDEVAALPNLKTSKNYTSLFLLFYNKTLVYYIFGEYSQAHISAQEVKKYGEAAQGVPHIPVLYFFEALTQLALYHQYSKKQKSYLKQAKLNFKKLKAFAKHAPMNFKHKCDLIMAELARAQGKKLKAIKLYKKAIAGAKKNEYLHEEAIANERAGEFYFELGLDSQGFFHLNQAHYLYNRWGAKAKVKQLERNYPKLLAEISKKEPSLSTTFVMSSTTNSKRVASQLDFASLIKASQTLSGEITLGSLASKLMHIVMENAGAQRALLLLNKSGKWFIEATRTLDKNQDSIPNSRQMVDVPDDLVPKSVIDYIIHTQEIVVLDNASEKGDFTNDTHIKKHTSKSLLGLPIINQGKLLGILTLQNFQAIGVFTSDRLQVLQTITTQVAISLENIRLYENLENLVEERTKELTKALDDLQKMVLELEKKNEQIVYLSNIDPLTGLYNRRQFDSLLKSEWQRLKREQKPLSLMIIDVDFFKSLNDTYGHQQGDDCLKLIANTIKQELKRPFDAAIRYGGDEFVGILPNTNLSGASQLAENLVNKIYELNIKNKHSKVAERITVSIGTATIIPSDKYKMEDLLAGADTMLYQVKEAGRYQFRSTFLS